MLKINKLYNLDCREGLLQLENESIDCCISSPPYWNLRDYGIGEDAIGLEPNFLDYIKNLANIYDGVKRVLKKSGTCWVNLGDCYGSGKGETGKKSETLKSDIKGGLDGKKGVKGFAKCLLMIPQRFAIEMINRGWILRNVIIWHKPNCMPSSARDRFTVDFEYVYFFVKNKKYWFEQQREPAYATPYSKNSLKGGNQEINNPRRNYKVGQELLGRNKRTVWKIPTKANPEAHFATFPPKLIEPMIKSGCPEYVCKECGKPREKIMKPSIEYQKLLGKKIYRYKKNGIINKKGNYDVDSESNKSVTPEYIFKGYTDCGCGKEFESGIVLDHFAGTGTTLKEAWRLGRNYIGFEISKEYCEIAKKGLSKTKNKRMDDFIAPQTPLQPYTEKDLKNIESQKEIVYRKKIRSKKVYDSKEPYKKNFPYQKKSTI